MDTIFIMKPKIFAVSFFHMKQFASVPSRMKKSIPSLPALLSSPMGQVKTTLPL